MDRVDVGQTSLRHGARDQVRRSNILIDARDGVNHRERRPRRARHVRDRRRRAVRPLQPDARAEVDAIRHDVVANAERVAHRGIEVRPVEKAVPVRANAVLHLDGRRRTPRVADRHPRRHLIARQVNRRQRPREGGRRSRLEIGERVEGERAERRADVGGVVLAREARRHLDRVLVVVAEPLQLIGELEASGSTPRWAPIRHRMRGFESTSCRRRGAIRHAPFPWDSRCMATTTVAAPRRPASSATARRTRNSSSGGAMPTSTIRRHGRSATGVRVSICTPAPVGCTCTYPPNTPERERVARARGARREVDVGLVVEAVRRSQARPVVERHGHALARQNREQPCRRIRRDAGRLQTERTGIQQRQIVGEGPLRRVGRVVERLVHLNRAAKTPAEPERRGFLSRRICALVSPLEIGSGAVSAQLRDTSSSIRGSTGR